MIAKLRVLLPFAFTIPEGAEMSAQEFDIASYSVRIHPPCLAAVQDGDISPTRIPLGEIARLIVPASKQIPGLIQVDGKPTVQANFLQIDFIKSTFDRRRETIVAEMPASLDLGDPSINYAFGVLNNWINRYRYLARSSEIRPIRYDEVFWALEYLADTGEPLPQDPSLFRLRTGAKQSLRVDLLDSAIWDAVGEIPVESKAHAWEVLLLDAPALLPEVGPSVVLAYAALEAFIDWCLDGLAPFAGVPPVLWNWINTRESFWLRPRTDEQFSVLLEGLTGKNLKNEATLWELFKNLRSARHSYVHTGHAEIGNKSVNLERATELVNGVSQIISWVEALLPKELRRRELQTKHEFKLSTIVPIAAIPPPAADVGPAQPQK